MSMRFRDEVNCMEMFGFWFAVKLLDWGEEGHRSDAEISSLRAAFTQEVVVWHKLDHPNVTKVKQSFIKFMAFLLKF